MRLSRSSVLMSVVASLAGGAASAAPIALGTNGFLLDSADHPVSQQAVNLGFSLWSDPVAGGRVWPLTGDSVCPTDVVQGRYAVVLDGNAASGCGAGLASQYLPGDQSRYLQVSVNGVALLPRQRLNAVPWAQHALDADTVGGETVTSLRDASKLTGVLPPAVYGGGSTSLTTLGTISAGTWQGSPISDAFIQSAGSWNARLSSVSRDGTLVGNGTAASPLGVNVGSTSGTVAAGDDARFGRWNGSATGLDAAAGRTSLGLGSAALSSATAFATAAQGAKADAALATTGGTVTGAVNFPGGVWTAAGGVGIGTTTPTAGTMLDVNGPLRVQGVPIVPSSPVDGNVYWTPQPYFEAGTFPWASGAAAPSIVAVQDPSVPFSKVARSDGHTEFSAEFIPVQAGETLYGEIWVMRQTGSTGAAGGFYFGVSRFDKDKKPIGGNAGLDYFVAQGNTVPQTGVWTKYAATVTLPTSHSAFEGSDGGPVRYVRPYVIVNYPGGTIPTYWAGATLRRVAPVRDAGPMKVNGDLSVGGLLKKDCKAGYTKCGRWCAKMVSTGNSIWEHTEAAHLEANAQVANFRELSEVGRYCRTLPAFNLPNPGIWLSESCGDYGSHPRTMNLFMPGPALFSGCAGDSLDCYGIDYTQCERIQSNPNGYQTTGGAVYVYQAEF